MKVVFSRPARPGRLDVSHVRVFLWVFTRISPRCSSEMTSRYFILDFPSGFTLAAREKSHITRWAEAAGSELAR